jgi:hypothetical protein
MTGAHGGSEFCHSTSSSVTEKKGLTNEGSRVASFNPFSGYVKFLNKIK